MPFNLVKYLLGQTSTETDRPFLSKKKTGSPDLGFGAGLGARPAGIQTTNFPMEL